MRRFIASFLALVGVAGSAWATGIAYDQNLANEVVTTTRTYTISMGGSDVGGGTLDLLSASAVLSSATPTTQTFTDGQVSTGSVTFGSTVTTLPAASATDTLTVSTNSGLSPTAGTDTLTVSSNTAGALTGATITLTGGSNTAVILAQGQQWQIGASSGATGLNIAAAINNTRYWTATSTYGVTTITCVTPQAACNTYTLVTSTPAALATGSANFSGGLDAASFTINSQKYTEGIDWAAAAQSSNTAVNIAGAINSLDTQGVTASTTASTVVTLTVTKKAASGNLFTLSSSTGALTVNTASFSGGRDAQSVIIDNVALVAGVDFAPGTSSATAATALVAAATNNVTLNGLITGSVSSGKATFTSVSVGTSQNFNLRTLSSSITVSGAQFTGGLNSAVSGNKITITSHGLSTGMAVLYTSGTVTIGGLTNQTTYYAIALDPNTLELATTSTGAVAGSFITFTSSSTAGPHTFTLAPLAMTGTPTVTWQASNDGLNWANLNEPVATFPSPYTASTTIWDFGTIDFKFVRASVAGPGAGGMKTTIRGYGKRYGLGL